MGNALGDADAGQRSLLSSNSSTCCCATRSRAPPDEPQLRPPLRDSPRKAAQGSPRDWSLAAESRLYLGVGGVAYAAAAVGPRGFGNQGRLAVSTEEQLQLLAMRAAGGGAADGPMLWEAGRQAAGEGEAYAVANFVEVEGKWYLVAGLNRLTVPMPANPPPGAGPMGSSVPPSGHGSEPGSLVLAADLPAAPVPAISPPEGSNASSPLSSPRGSDPGPRRAASRQRGRPSGLVEAERQGSKGSSSSPGSSPGASARLVRRSSPAATRPMYTYVSPRRVLKRSKPKVQLNRQPERAGCGLLRLWALAAAGEPGQAQESAEVPAEIVCMAVHGARIYVADAAGRCSLYELRQGQLGCVRRVTACAGPLVALDAAEAFVFTAGVDCVVSIWGAKLLKGHTALQPDTYAAGRNVHAVTGVLRPPRRGPAALFLALLSGEEEGLLCAWDLAKREGRGCTHAHRGAITALALAEWEPNEPGTVFTAGVDGRVRTWEAHTLTCVRSLSLSGAEICALAVDPRQRLLAVFADGWLQSWTIAPEGPQRWPPMPHFAKLIG